MLRRYRSGDFEGARAAITARLFIVEDVSFALRADLHRNYLTINRTVRAAPFADSFRKAMWVPFSIWFPSVSRDRTSADFLLFNRVKA
jgi:hypothetical protein